MSRRILIGSSTAVLVALAGGVLLGLSLRHESESAFIVSSQWVHRTDGKIDLRVLSGTILGASRFPVVVLDHGNASAPETLKLSDANDGPLTIVEAEEDEGGNLTTLLRSRDGYFYALDGSFLTQMGRRLDPNALPALPRVGVAVPVHYGADDRRRAVILVAQTPKYIWHVIGFLDGFSVSDNWSATNERLLIGRTGSFFLIDPAARRLEPIRKEVTQKRWSQVYDGSSLGRSPCEPWPAKHGVYLGCPGRIRLLNTGGAETTIYRDTKCGHDCHFQPVIPSPDGRTLLVQNVYLGPAGCAPSSVSFLPKDARSLVDIDPSYDFNQSWALGWLDSHTALIGANGPGGECFPPPSGIWAVDPRYPTYHEQVLKTTSTDATIWRSN